jgi:caffeoyl-CoA O-methyltransferase
MKTALGLAILTVWAGTMLRPRVGATAEDPAVAAVGAPVPSSLDGVVQSLNYAPRGECNGVLLKSEGRLIQVNLPPRESIDLNKGIAIGDRIRASVVFEKTDADHAVCRPRELITARGRKFTWKDQSPGGNRQRPTEPRPSEPGPGISRLDLNGSERLESTDADRQMSLETLPAPKDAAEGRILKVIQEIPKKQAWLVNVPASDARLLRLLAEAIDAKNVVEIGTSNGISAIWFGLALRKTGGKLITHEINPDAVALARKNFASAGVGELITIVEGDAHQTVSRLKGPIDLVFIAADKNGYLDYLTKLLPLVRPGGLIVAHSVPSRVDPAFVKAIMANPDLETRFYLQGDGMSITLKKR